MKRYVYNTYLLNFFKQEKYNVMVFKTKFNYRI